MPFEILRAGFLEFVGKKDLRPGDAAIWQCELFAGICLSRSQSMTLGVEIKSEFAQLFRHRPGS